MSAALPVSPCANAPKTPTPPARPRASQGAARRGGSSALELRASGSRRPRSVQPDLDLLRPRVAPAGRAAPNAPGRETAPAGRALARAQGHGHHVDPPAGDDVAVRIPARALHRHR